MNTQRIALLGTVLLGIFVLAAACGEGEEAQKVPTATGEEAASPTAEPTVTPSADGAAHYENTELGFAFDYPDDWERIRVPVTAEEVGEIETIASVVLGTIVEDTGELNGISINVHRLEAAVPEEALDEFLLEFDGMVTQLAGQVGGALEERDWTELGGRTARRYVMNFPYEGLVPSTSEYVITVREEHQFELNCQAEQERFEDVRAGCQVVFESFEFTARSP